MTEAILYASPITLPAGSLDRKGIGWWGLVCVIAGESALFAYLLFAYFYCAVELGPEWLPGKLPELRLALPNTLILLLSSVTVWLAERNVRKGNRKRSIAFLIFTIALGVAFVSVQLLEWKAKQFSLSSGTYGSLYFTITGFHMAHVAAGLLALSLALVWCALGYFSPRRNVPMLIIAAYWHFVDVVWLFVFSAIYLSPRLW